MARSGRHSRSASKAREVAGTHERAEATETATLVMTAVRLVISAWELAWTLLRDHASGGGPGRILLRTRPERSGFR